ncbi:hypothetical protein [Candidatus Tisiphia endosymbiont of Temnostethus pusillus]
MVDGLHNISFPSTHLDTKIFLQATLSSKKTLTLKQLNEISKDYVTLI